MSGEAGSAGLGGTRPPGAAEPYAAALAGLPGMNPRRLVKLLDGFPPVVAWRAIAAGTHPADPHRRFAAAARRADVDKVAERHARLGVHTLLPGCHGYPSDLVGDPGAPAVLFALGDPMALEGGPRVAIVGTRSATHYGRRVASELAGALAGEGVTIVSGLASGIDAAAHAGVLRSGQSELAPPATHPDAAPSATHLDLVPSGTHPDPPVTQPRRAAPVGVVGTGLDVVYPSSSRELWAEVAKRGIVFSESPLGTQPHPGVFPARNRIIAALSDVVVVVESHARGGALYTAEAAARRSIPVCAVPGSVHSRASEGSNALLVDGCIPVRDADDVMVALGLVRAGKNLAPIRGAGKTTRWARPDRSESRTGKPGSKDAVSHDQTGCVDASGVGVAFVGDQEPVVECDDRLEADRAGPLTPPQQALLDAIDDTPTAFETILIRTDLSIAAAAEACDQLVERGILRSGAGWWSTA